MKRAEMEMRWNGMSAEIISGMAEWRRAGYIAQFLVSQSYRQHGVGKLLMDYINNWFDARGLQKVLLNVDIDNETGVRFWKNKGFKLYATRMKRLNA